MEAPSSTSVSSDGPGPARPRHQRRSFRRSAGSSCSLHPDPLFVRSRDPSPCEQRNRRRLENFQASADLISVADGVPEFTGGRTMNSVTIPSEQLPPEDPKSQPQPVPSRKKRSTRSPEPEDDPTCIIVTPPCNRISKGTSNAERRRKSDGSMHRNEPNTGARRLSPHGANGSSVSPPAPSQSRNQTPTTQRQYKKPGDIDNKIKDVLKRPLSKTDKSNTLGQNYIFEAMVNAPNEDDDDDEVYETNAAGDPIRTPPERKKKTISLLKIGSTKNGTDKRSGRISRECRHSDVREKYFPEDRPIRLYSRMEKLVQAELAHLQHQFKCSCGKTHEEYFNVTEDLAREVARRWRTFCILEPYGDDGMLKPFWEYKLNNLRNSEKSETLDCHEERAKRWGEFSNPTLFDLVCYGGARIQPRIYLIASWVLSLLICSNLFNFSSIALLALITKELFSNSPAFDLPLLAVIFGFQESLLKDTSKCQESGSDLTNLIDPWTETNAAAASCSVAPLMQKVSASPT